MALFSVFRLQLFLPTEHGHGHSHGGGGHGHSHGGHGHKSKLSTINTLVATDDNENDERFTPPPPNSVGANDKHGNGTPRREASAQMNMRGVFLHVLSDALGNIRVLSHCCLHYALCFQAEP